MKEILGSIQKTLNYAYSGNVYIFYQDPLLVTYMRKQNLDKNQRVTFVANTFDTLSALFEYANENLVNKTVMILNADTYPVDGFENLNSFTLRANKLVYLISR